MKTLPDEIMIGFIEIPDEISLCIPITGCQNNCKLCHSPHYRMNIGVNLLAEIDNIMEKVKDKITCVCLMGEGTDKKKLFDVVQKILPYNKKVALYSGRDSVESSYYMLFDYIKIGRYIPELGPLNSKTTNQKLIRCSDMEDITYLFRRNND